MTGRKKHGTHTGASTPRTGTMVKARRKTRRKSNDTSIGASSPSTRTPRRPSLLGYKFADDHHRAWLAMPFMIDIEVLPGPAYYPSGFKQPATARRKNDQVDNSNVH